MDVIPFGRHRGKPVASLPRDYLRWLQTRPLYGRLKLVVDAVLAGPPVPPSRQQRVSQVCPPMSPPHWADCY
jgi:hypothetical protein